MAELYPYYYSLSQGLTAKAGFSPTDKAMAVQAVLSIRYITYVPH